MSDSITLCATCGVEHDSPLPDVCAICNDDRQYLPADGIQKWTTLSDLQVHRTTSVRELEPRAYGITSDPPIAIGQRSVLVQTNDGNLLFDPLNYIDDDAVNRVSELGGIRWIVPSHPHMYGVQLEWSAAFSNATVLVNARDKEWLARTGDAIEFWEGEYVLTPDLKLLETGGHFPGQTVVHWTGADGAGVLLSGDAIVPVADRGWATFMRSYPNQIPLSAKAIRRIADTVKDLTFDRLYANTAERVCPGGASDMVQRSADRYIGWITGEFDDQI